MAEPYAVLTITETGGFRTQVDTRTNNIRRLDGACEPSGQWQMTGLAEARPFGRLTREYTSPLNVARSLNEIRREGLKFKNGKPRLFVRDYDHGTQRVRMAGVTDIRVDWRTAE